MRNGNILLELARSCAACLGFTACAEAGVLSDYAQGGNVEMRSLVEVGFYGANHIGGTDSTSDVDILSIPPTGSHSTSASKNIVPAGTHHPQDVADGTATFNATYQPGGTDVLTFDFSGLARAQNAHNALGNPADGKVHAVSLVNWFVGFSPVANKPVAGRLILPGLPALPEGVTMMVKLEQTTCCPPTVQFSAPHDPVEIDIWHANGYTLSVTLDIAAPFGNTAAFSYNYNYPVQAITRQAGDYNGNQIIDSADYVVWRKQIGLSGSGLAADGSGASVGYPDGIVDQFDYTYWRSHFGQSFVSGSGSLLGGSASVPEPHAASFVACALAVVGSVIRRRQIRRGRHAS